VERRHRASILLDGGGCLIFFFFDSPNTSIKTFTYWVVYARTHVYLLIWGTFSSKKHEMTAAKSRTAFQGKHKKNVVFTLGPSATG
jgi:hypothetical protein